MPVWLQALIAIFAALGIGGILLEVVRRRNARSDKKEEGNATVIVKQIDDGAAQRGEWWTEIERLRARVDRQDEKLEKMRSYCWQLWEYLLEVKQAYLTMASQLQALGHEVPPLPAEPPKLREVLQDDIHSTK